MQWVLLGVLVLALILMSAKYPKLAFGLLGGLLFGVAIIVFVTGDYGLNAKSKITPEQLSLENVVLVPGYGGSYKFNSRTSNQHDTALVKEVVLSLTLFDCPQSESVLSDCQIVGQSEERTNVRIPAGQSRDISKSVYLGEIDIKGSLRWEVITTKARS